MPFDYLADFPVPAAELPKRLRDLLAPEGLSSDAKVVVAALQDFCRGISQRERLQLITAIVPNGFPTPLANLRETGSALVATSVPVGDVKGGDADYRPSLSGHDYVVAAWGDGSFYGYHLAEKVWMMMGLSPRCVGGDDQRLIYDDLSLPGLAIAEGRASTRHDGDLEHDVLWTINNARLRQYLWQRDASVARVFYYEALLEKTPTLDALMGGGRHLTLSPEAGWFEVDLRAHPGGLLLQVWATVVAVDAERCPPVAADGLNWPEHGVMTAGDANALMAPTLVHLDDRFLERYEQNPIYDITPFQTEDAAWLVDPSYRHQWTFTQCVRAGRNIIRVPMRELYKPKPDQEIVHAHSHVLDPQVVNRLDLNEEHIAAKTQRLLDAFLDMADALVALGRRHGLTEAAFDLTKISRVELRAEGWRPYPQLAKLAQVAPLAMTQQAFLARCKSLHEFWQVLPNGYFKRLLIRRGLTKREFEGKGSLKLLQILLNIVEALNKDHEDDDGLAANAPPEGWDARSNALAVLFVLYDLRIADAHDASEYLHRLKELGVDTASLYEGYGRALDVVFDRMIGSFERVTSELETLVSR
ncbi:MAG: hypothetical protein ACYDD1_00870 [Caulobacteraceae bacterium]